MIVLVAGARPNFIKIAPLIKVLPSGSFKLVHTGQHYDYAMSQSFFDELLIPQPDFYLNAKSGTQAEQTASIMLAFEQVLATLPAKLVLVVGDVTSTMACTIVAKKLCIQVAHVEAGIRSFDLSMPEEINRMVTDSISDLFFTTSKWASGNLVKSGIAPEKIHFVGNVMIDTLLQNLPKLKQPPCWEQLQLISKAYFILTLHRPSNVDNPAKLRDLLTVINEHAAGHKVIFPVHPRTKKVFLELDIQFENIFPIDPLSYLNFNYLVKNSKAVITDSGGITEETTVLGIPCITIRTSTERPETVEIGTNELIGDNPNSIAPVLSQIVTNKWKKGEIPERWDGKSAERIVGVLMEEGYLS